jgi:hypothetical protein
MWSCRTDADEAEVRAHFEKLFRLDIDDEYSNVGTLAIIRKCLRKLRDKRSKRTSSSNTMNTESRYTVEDKRVHALDASVGHSDFVATSNLDVSQGVGLSKTMTYLPRFAESHVPCYMDIIHGVTYCCVPMTQLTRLAIR